MGLERVAQGIEDFPPAGAAVNVIHRRVRENPWIAFSEFREGDLAWFFRIHSVLDLNFEERERIELVSCYFEITKLFFICRGNFRVCSWHTLSCSRQGLSFVIIIMGFNFHVNAMQLQGAAGSRPYTHGPNAGVRPADGQSAALRACELHHRRYTEMGFDVTRPSPGLQA